MASLNKCAPWIEHYRKIEAFFKKDPGIMVIYDDTEAEDLKVKVYVEETEKAKAIEELLLPDVTFGNVTLKVEVVPGNKESSAAPFFLMGDITGQEVYTKAFAENDALKFIRVIDGIGGCPWVYLVFAEEVVQYFTDDYSSIYGKEATLYENIAREIFKPVAGVFYCTESE